MKETQQIRLLSLRRHPFLQPLGVFGDAELFSEIADVASAAGKIVRSNQITTFAALNRTVRMTPEQTQQIIKHLLPYQPTRIGLFGSYARGDNKPGSDLDIMVSFGVQMDLVKLMKAWDSLEDALGIRVDLVTENALNQANPLVQQSISSDLQVIYEV